MALGLTMLTVGSYTLDSTFYRKEEHFDNFANLALLQKITYLYIHLGFKLSNNFVDTTGS